MNFTNYKNQRIRIPGRMVCEDVIHDNPQSIVDGFTLFFKILYFKPPLDTDGHGEDDDVRPLRPHKMFLRKLCTKCYNKTYDKMTAR